MDLILCHQTADFDALGAAVGLSRLKPDSRIVLTGGAHPIVKGFLSLYRDEFSLLEMRSIDPEKITSIAVVDTQKRDRLGKADQWLDLAHLTSLEVYDHHVGSQCDIPASHLVVESVGSVTTMIVEMLRNRDILLTTSESTVMALGIHVDTGSLTFDSSKPRDALALAWLMEQGANLSILAEYISPAFSPEQQKMLTLSLDQMERYLAGGHTLGVVLVTTDHFIDGLSSVAESIIQLTDIDALLLANQYLHHGGSRLTIIGRSRISTTNLNQLFVPLGGGGHAQAASVNLRDFQSDQVLEQLRIELLAQFPRPLLAIDLMSSPVRTVRPETTIGQAQLILLRYGHSGLSVVNEYNQLVGIISRRDLDLAMHHGFGHSPVKGYMATNPKTISPETTLPEIQSMMLRYDIGRLPVVHKAKLLGIVTRTDVISQAFRNEHCPAQTQVKVSCLLPSLRKQIHPRFWDFLIDASAEANQRGWHLYLVGGVVRDLILSLEDSPLELKDIDLVVDSLHHCTDVGAGMELAKALEKKHPDVHKSVYGAFQTAYLSWTKDSELAPLCVDIATARTEFYLYPAANPEVEASSIRQDLYRRDFTINALAVRLSSPKTGELLDFFGGLEDLHLGLIRVLHANSFIEDPTRIYRAVRFAIRLNFQLEDQTRNYIQNAIESGVYKRLRFSKQSIPALTTRLKAELKLILEARYWHEALKMLSELGGLSILAEDLTLDVQLSWQLRYASRWLNLLVESSFPPDWLIRLEIILSAIVNPQVRLSLAQSMALPKNSFDRLSSLDHALKEISQKFNTTGLPSEIYALLSCFKPATLVIVAAKSERAGRRKIWHYLSDLSKRQSILSGEDLKSMGFHPGPNFKVILAAVMAATLDNRITSIEEAKAFVRNFF